MKECCVDVVNYRGYDVIGWHPGGGNVCVGVKIRFCPECGSKIDKRKMKKRWKWQKP